MKCSSPAALATAPSQNSAKERYKKAHLWVNKNLSWSVLEQNQGHFIKCPELRETLKMLLNILFQNRNENKSPKLQTFFHEATFTSMGHTLDRSCHGYLKDRVQPHPQETSVHI